MRMLQWPGEVQAFTAFINSERVNSVLEIGTGPGGFIHYLGRLTTGRLITVDLPASGDATGLSLRDCEERNGILEAAFRPRLTALLGDSHTDAMVERVAEALEGESVDLLFLDGDDSYEGKAEDFDRYSRFVGQGGWIATHDINAQNTGVPRWWANVVRGLDESEIRVFSENRHWGGIGAARWGVARW